MTKHASRRRSAVGLHKHHAHYFFNCVPLSVRRQDADSHQIDLPPKLQLRSSQLPIVSISKPSIPYAIRVIHPFLFILATKIDSSGSLCLRRHVPVSRTVFDRPRSFHFITSLWMLKRPPHDYSIALTRAATASMSYSLCAGNYSSVYSPTKLLLAGARQTAFFDR